MCLHNVCIGKTGPSVCCCWLACTQCNVLVCFAYEQVRCVSDCVIFGFLGTPGDLPSVTLVHRVELCSLKIDTFFMSIPSTASMRHTVFVSHMAFLLCH